MRTQPSVSVIIPTLNEEEFLPQLIECLKSQSYPPLQIIVADNNSTDGTLKLCRAFGLKVTDGGLPGRGRNRGAQVASGDYLLFLDADTHFDNTFIASLLAEMGKRDLDIASCWFYPNTKSLALRSIHAASNLYFWVTTILGFPHGIGACLMVRRQLHRLIGGFDETVRVAEDQDYIKRASRRGGYDFLPHPKINISVRRFIREGYFRLCSRWVFVDLYRATLGEIRREGLIKYF
jgi:glycosyltransferase involved in cell wall biosynthesis